MSVISMSPIKVIVVNPGISKFSMSPIKVLVVNRNQGGHEEKKVPQTDQANVTIGRCTLCIPKGLVFGFLK